MMLCMTSDAPSLRTILQPAIDALRSVGLASRALRVEQATTIHEAHELLDAASEAIWSIRDHDKHLASLPDEDGRERAMLMEDYTILDDVHTVVIRTRTAVFSMPRAA